MESADSYAASDAPLIRRSVEEEEEQGGGTVVLIMLQYHLFEVEFRKISRRNLKHF